MADTNLTPFQIWWQEHGTLDYDEMVVAIDAWDYQQKTFNNIMRLIPVAERLPEDQVQVLVRLEPTKLQREKDKEICHCITAAYHEGKWYDFQSDEDIDETLTRVVGWMPLPPILDASCRSIYATAR